MAGAQITQTLDRFFAQTARRFGHLPAWKAPDGERTHGEVFESGARLANTLRGAGLAEGDHVAMMLDDSVVALEIFAGISLAGMVAVPVNRAATSEELDFILDSSSARGLVYTDTARESVFASSGRSELGVCIDAGACEGERPVAVRGYSEVATASAQPPSVDRGSLDIAMLAYTSGTTGFPKGAIISHRSIITCVRTAHGAHRLPNYARMAHVGSLQFSAPWWALLLPHLFTGGFVRLLGRFSIDSWFDSMIEDRSTFTYVPSPLIPAFTEEARSRPQVLEYLQVVQHSASSAPRDQLAELVEVIGDRFEEAYGTTETVGVVSATTRADLQPGCEADDMLTSVGRAVPTAMLHVADAEGNILPHGSDIVGDLWIEAETLFDGYWNQPEQTAEVLRDGRFRTGDLARIDSHGYIYILGRKSELIVSGGANVYPAELERVLSAMDGVADCSVFGVPHERWGEAVVAAVVKSAQADLQPDEVIAYVGSHLTAYKKPKAVIFLEELPRNASQKVQRHRMRELFEESSVTVG